MDWENIFVRNPLGLREVLKEKIVGIAGCGGLGSNIAISLTRAGIGHLVLADFDRVELSNLNRQQYYLDDVGRFKVDALTNHLLAINPELKISKTTETLIPDNLTEIFAEVDVMVEAFDLADRKRWLIDSWLTGKKEVPLVCGSGVAGYGKTGDLRVSKYGKLYVCGDQKSDMSEGLCAPRVAIVSNMQANTVLEILMEVNKK